MLLEVVPLGLLVLLRPLVAPHVPRGEVEQLVETGGVHGASGEEHLGALQVWSLTQFYSVDFSKSRINVKKCIFNKRTIKVCVSCC